MPYSAPVAVIAMRLKSHTLSTPFEVHLGARESRFHAPYLRQLCDFRISSMMPPDQRTWGHIVKVNDLLSSATIGSSRALSGYAAIVFVVLWAGTPPQNIPPMSSLELKLFDAYAFAAILLVFMIVAHAVSFTNDILSVARDQSLTRADNLDKHDEEMNDPTYYQEKPYRVWGEKARDHRERSWRLYRGMRATNLVTVYAMHAAIPFGLSLTALTWLMSKLVDAWA